MQNWLRITLLLCLFGLLREIRPSEPFVTEFLLGEWRNITEEQLNRDIYPVGTYSYLSQLVVVFLFTDFLRFKPVIILSGLSGIAVYAVLLWTRSLQWIQVSQYLYGVYMATEVAYLTYIYAKVDADKYPLVSSYTRIAALAGRFLSGMSAQLLTHYDVMNYRDLNYITFAAQVLATFWAIWLPPVRYGIYFHRRTSVTNDLKVDFSVPSDKTCIKPIQQEQRTIRQQLVEASSLIARHARLAYSRPKVLAWSALYAVALALFVQTQTYMQLLWKQIQENSKHTVAYNGFVEAAQTLLGAGGAFLASTLSQSTLPAPVAAMQSLALFLGTYWQNIYVSYAGYIVMGTLFQYNITLASSKIASQMIDESCFGLIFGINTLIGTGLQSLLTLILIQKLELSIFIQYFVISGLLLVLAIIWLLGDIINKCKWQHTFAIS
ncbi:hypothetical protein ACJJTC_006992 [Scirpophaga incertulas]